MKFKGDGRGRFTTLLEISEKSQGKIMKSPL